MGDGLLRYRNNYLVVQQNLLLDCCCDEAGGPYYWEGLPCDATMSPNPSMCTTGNQCACQDIKYFNYMSLCAGVERKICECQLLQFHRPSGVYLGYLENALEFQMTDWASTSGSVIITEDLIELTSIPDDGSPNIVDYIYLTGNYKSFSSINDDCLATSRWQVNTNVLLSDSSSAFALIPTGFNVTLAVPTGVPAQSKVRIGFAGQTSNWIYPTGDQGISGFVTGILSEILNFDNINSVTPYYLDTDPPNQNFRRYHLVFDGVDCGREIPPVLEIKNGILAKDTQFPTADNSRNEYFKFMDGERYDDEYGTIYANDYLQHRLIGSGGIFLDGGQCPFTPDLDGLPRRDDGKRCCPQKGCTLGPDQYIGPTGNFNYAPSAFDLSLLETTVWYNGQCYKLNEYFFQFGLLGRFRPANVDPDRTIGTSGSLLFGLPTNASVKMFIPFFNKNLPWGGFGSYYAGVFDAEYVSGDCDETGGQHAPRGEIRAVGGWLSTEYIWIRFKSYEPFPFSSYTGSCGSYAQYLAYIGSTYGNSVTGRHDPSSPSIQRIASKVDPSTLGGFEILENPSSSNSFYNILTYETSGKRLADFVRDANNLKTLISVTGGTTAQGCNIFSFCLGLPEATGLPLSYVNNASSDLWELGWACHPGNAGYLPDEDSVRKVTSDIFGPQAYEDTFPTFTTLGHTGTPPAISVYPAIYDSLDSTLANLPPKNRILTNLPKTEYLNCSGTFVENGTSQWFQSMQLSLENTVKIIKSTGLLDGYSSLTLSLISGTSVTVFASGTNHITSGRISTNKAGSGYSVNQFAADMTALSMVPSGGGTMRPVFATGLFPYFNIYLDDSSWASGVYPAAPHSTNAIASGNYGYKEPFVTGTSYEMADGTANYLSNIIRRRSWSLISSGGRNVYITDLLDSISPSARVISTRLSCDLDTVYDRNWILTYNCSSNICKTTYYYKAKRCSCTDTWDSDGCHRQTNGNVLTASEVYTPRLYFCRDNVHPLCTVPILFKVPIQSAFACDTGATGYCPDPYWQFYNGIPADPLCVTYNDSDAWLDSDEGWCQYYDGSNDVVSYEDIPRAYPAEAYILGKTVPPFCPTKPYLQALEIYDRIGYLKPNYPPEYIDPISGYRCSREIAAYYETDDPDQLVGAIRPAIAPFVYHEWYGGTDCTRIDVDCTTKCCDCFFIPQVDNCGNGVECITNDGPYQCNCTQNVTYSKTITDDSGPVNCGIVNYCDGAASCNFGPCDHGGGSNYQGASWKGAGKTTLTTTITANLVYHYGCCSCEGNINTSYSFNSSVSCNGNYGGDTDRPVFDPCGTPPSHACETDGLVSCSFGGLCAAPGPQISSCPSNPYDLNEVSTSTSGDCTCDDYGDTSVYTCASCIEGVDCGASTSNESYAALEYNWTCRVYGFNVCSVGTNTWKSKNVVDYSATLTEDLDGCTNGQAMGYSSANPSDYHEVLTTETIGSFTIGPIACGACPYSITDVTYDEYVNILNDIEITFVCGYALE